MPQPNPGLTEWTVVEAVGVAAFRDQLNDLSAMGWTVFAVMPESRGAIRFVIAAFRIVASS